MKRLLFGAMALFMGAGCASTSTMGLARTLNKGAVQGWVGLEGGGIIAAPASTGSTTAGAGIGYPMIEGGVRVGASDHVELGARLGFNGIGLEGKFALLRSPTMDRGINLSLAPQVGFFGIGIGPVFVGSLTAQLPLLIGIDFGGHELVLGPKLFNQVYFVGVSDSGSGGGAVVNLLSAGASVGFAIKAGPVRIVPEVSAVVPFFATGAITGVSGAATGTGVGGVIFQAGVGLLFGSANSYERPLEVAPSLEAAPPAPQPMPYPVQPIPLESPPPPPPQSLEAPTESP